MSKNQKTKHERLEARISFEQKELFNYAANLLGISLTDLVIRALQDTSSRVVNEYGGLIKLSSEDSKAFISNLINPAEPNKKLKKALAHYNRKLA